MSLHTSKETFPSLSSPSPQPTLVPTVHQALGTGVLPLFISHLVVAHDHLSTLVAYFIDFISQEARNYTCDTIIPFSTTLGKSTVLYPSLGPFTSLVTDVLPIPGQVFIVYRTVGLTIIPGTYPSLLKEKCMSVLYRV